MLFPIIKIMAHFLVYWKIYWEEYGPEGAKDHVQTKGYGSTNLKDVSRGSTIWVVVTDSTRHDEWKIAQQIYVARLDRDELETSTRFRAVADPHRSHFFEIQAQPNAERVLQKLTFRSGKRITASGRQIGLSIQSVRPLSPADAKLLEDYCHVFSSDRSETVIDQPDEDLENGRRRRVELNLIYRNPEFVKWIKSIYQDICQVCGVGIEIPGGRKYSEVHHIRPLGKPHDGPDETQNMLCVCPNCHARLDYGAIQLRTQALKKLDPAHKLSKNHLTYHNESICSRS